MDTSRIEIAARDILDSIEKGDVIATYSESSPIDFDMDHIKSIEDINRFAIGARIFKNGRVGNSFINSLDDKDFLLKSAAESAGFGDELDLALPGNSDYPSLGFYFPEVLEYKKEDGVDLGKEMIKDLKSIDNKAKVSVSVSKSYSRNYIANTSGFSGSYEETHFGLSANMLLVEDNGGLLYVGDGDSSYGLNIDLETIRKNIEWRYKNALNKVSVRSGYFPVLFTPEAIGLLLESIEIAANAKSLYKGISVLGEKLDKKIGDDRLTLIDDPLYIGGLGSYPFDDEGVIPKRLPIIENGVFKNFIYDLTTAKRLGKASTGHGSRSVSSLPVPSFSNLILETGDTALEDMIAFMDYGLIVYEFLGGGMSNIIAGDFSVNIELGYLVEKGKVKGRVKDTMISGNVYDILNSIKAIENKLYKKGSLYSPHILFDRVSVAG